MLGDVDDDLVKDNQLIGGMDTLLTHFYVETDLSSSGNSDLNNLGASGVKALLQKA